MKSKIQFALVLLALATGCAARHDKIAFSDDAEVRAAMASAATSPALPKMDKASELRLEELVFSYLLDRHFWDLADYSAVFLQADDAEVKAMIKKFPDHNPPIKQTFRVLVQPHRTPVDKDTNKPAMILSADINEPNPDGSVDAIGRWYAGDAVTGFRAFHFVKTGDDWQLTEVK